MEQTIKILSVLLVIVPIGAFILGYYLCHRELSMTIKQQQEDKKHSCAVYEEIIANMDIELELFRDDNHEWRKRNQLLEKQLIGNSVIGSNITEIEQLHTERDQLFKDIREGYTNC